MLSLAVTRDSHPVVLNERPVITIKAGSRNHHDLGPSWPVARRQGNRGGGPGGGFPHLRAVPRRWTMPESSRQYPTSVNSSGLKSCHTFAAVQVPSLAESLKPTDVNDAPPECTKSLESSPSRLLAFPADGTS